MLVHICPSTQTVVETRQDSFHVQVTDTVGCGDSFAAAVRPLGFHISINHSLSVFLELQHMSLHVVLHASTILWVVARACFSCVSSGQ